MKQNRIVCAICAAMLLTATACGTEQSVSQGSLPVIVNETTTSSADTEQTSGTTTTAAVPDTSAETTAVPAVNGTTLPQSIAVITTQPQGSTQRTSQSSTSHTTATTASQSSQPTQTTAQTQPASGVTRQENGVTIVDSGTDHPRAIEVFYGNNEVGKRYAQYVSEWKARLGSGVNVYSMVAPSSQAVYQPDDLPNPSGSQADAWNNISANLSGVTGIPLIYTMSAHKSEAIYSRTDYHWLPLGAYYAASVFAGKAGVPFPALSSYQAVTREGYIGAFYRVNKVAELGNYPEQFTYYKPANLSHVTCTYYDTAHQNPTSGSLLKENLAIGASYQIFGGRDDLILEVNTNAGTGRKLVIFKDSFGNALTPFLTQSFDKIVVCDFRYFDIDPIQFIKNEGATDLLFCMTTSNIMSQKKTQNLKDMLG